MNEQEKAELKKINANRVTEQSKVDINDIFEEETGQTEREMRKSFNKVYKSVRKALVVLSAKKKTESESIEEILEQTRAVLRKGLLILRVEEEEEETEN